MEPLRESQVNSMVKPWPFDPESDMLSIHEFHGVDHAMPTIPRLRRCLAVLSICSDRVLPPTAQTKAAGQSLGAPLREFEAKRMLNSIAGIRKELNENLAPSWLSTLFGVYRIFSNCSTLLVVIAMSPRGIFCDRFSGGLFKHLTGSAQLGSNRPLRGCAPAQGGSSSRLIRERRGHA